MIKDPGEISSVLNFLSKMLDKFEDKQDKDDYQKTKAKRGHIMISRGELWVNNGSRFLCLFGCSFVISVKII